MKVHEHHEISIEMICRNTIPEFGVNWDDTCCCGVVVMLVGFRKQFRWKGNFQKYFEVEQLLVIPENSLCGLNIPLDHIEHGKIHIALYFVRLLEEEPNFIHNLFQELRENTYAPLVSLTQSEAHFFDQQTHYQHW